MTMQELEKAPSRYVTVLHQIRDHNGREEGERFLVHGEQLDPNYQIDEGQEGFVVVARPIAVIDIGAEIEDEELTDWCNSHAGKAVLSRYWPDITVEDPTLPDAGDLVESNHE